MGSLLRFRFGGSDSAADYSSVLVPLEEAHLHSHSARVGRCEFEERPPADDDDDDDDEEEAGVGGGHGSRKDRETESQGMLEMSAAEYSIEGLRKEVRRGGRSHWTDYECVFFIVLTRA